MAGACSSPEKATQEMGSECAGMVRMAVPAATSHTTTVSSNPALTSSAPLALKAQDMT